MRFAKLDYTFMTPQGLPGYCCSTLALPMFKDGVSCFSVLCGLAVTFLKSTFYSMVYFTTDLKVTASNCCCFCAHIWYDI